MAPHNRVVHRVDFELAERTLLQLPGFRRALHAGPSRSFPLGVDMWYEADPTALDTSLDVVVHVNGTGHPFSHRGVHLSTFISVGVWHVFVELHREVD